MRGFAPRGSPPCNAKSCSAARASISISILSLTSGKTSSWNATTCPNAADRRIPLSHYQGPVRQMSIADLGHEQPTVLLTNDLRTSAAKRITRYAQRPLIENSLADSVDFFHLDALSSAVRLKVDFDVTLTEAATGLYRMLGRLLPGYEAAKSRQQAPEHAIQ